MCYHLLMCCRTQQTDQLLQRCVEGRPINAVITDFLAWCSDCLAAQSLTGLFLIINLLGADPQVLVATLQSKSPLCAATTSLSLRGRWVGPSAPTMDVISAWSEGHALVVF